MNIAERILDEVRALPKAQAREVTRLRDLSQGAIRSARRALIRSPGRGLMVLITSGTVIPVLPAKPTESEAA